MRINAVSSVSYNSYDNSKKQNFTGLCTGAGKVRNPGGQPDYTAVIYDSFTDGVQISGGFTPMGRQIIKGPGTGLTKAEGKQAWEFLSGKNTEACYDAAVKLRKFIYDTKIPAGTEEQHNAIFLDLEEDGVLSLENSSRVRLKSLNQKISAYEQSKGLKPEGVLKPATQAAKKPWLQKDADGKPIEPKDMAELERWVRKGYMPTNELLSKLLQAHGVA